MAPDPHPSILAVRSPEMDFRLRPIAIARCASCGQDYRASDGGWVTEPCGKPDCRFELVAPLRDRMDGAWWDAVNAGLRGADARGPWSDIEPRRTLEPPPPPEDRDEWLRRGERVRAMAPALWQSWHDLPLGWLGLVELAAHALDARGLGQALVHRQSKEKFGTARIYVGFAEGWAPEDGEAASDLVSWATSLSSGVCARYGTPDGKMRKIGGWWITLGERAHAEVSVPGRWPVDIGLYPVWRVRE